MIDCRGIGATLRLRSAAFSKESQAWLVLQYLTGDMHLAFSLYVASLATQDRFIVRPS